MRTADITAAELRLRRDALRKADACSGTPFWDYAMPALPVLLTSLHREARLSPDGLRVAENSIASALATQLRVSRLLREKPEIARVDLGGPVFITGLFRTGSTLLHRLLARHPGLRVPLLWELLSPGDPRDRPARITTARAYVEEYYRAAPAFRAIHPLSATEPEECHRLTGASLHADIYALRYRVPHYGRWLARQDLTGAYRAHRDQLRCLLWRRPSPRTGPVVLKCPSHLWHLPTLAKVYPDARIVRLHRDPVRCLTSLCNLTAVVRGARSTKVSPAEIGDYWSERVTTALDGVGPVESLHGLPVLDVSYADLVTDPVGTAGRVGEFAGAAFTPAAATGMRAYLAADPARPGPREYHPGVFGLDVPALDRRFAAYREAFGLHRTPSPTKGPST
ncbi:putative sulfotransferase [Actinorhabdospora filicis]|uniref:Sulfotransferase n=1 Tax=Actinorhabdospora filicis TaxID=1785913 RepID=A0A9W6SLN0_9ACTN|nr:sulfotransferase [Actinorhabdospora filicis]GLZ78268.1 putative sulfotransferase [Actinorhabdospora filicis]